MKAPEFFPGCNLRLALLTGIGWILMGTPADARAGEDAPVNFAREFLAEYPNFRAEGTMTSALAGRPPYRCRFELEFSRAGGLTFRYNTDAARDIIPYDYRWADRRLRETVYNRQRTEILEEKEVGAPIRSLFNFVGDLLGEIEHGPGVKSLLFNGLMSMKQVEIHERIHLVLARRFPGVPVQEIQFGFDAAKRLRSIRISLTNGNEHLLEIRRFRPLRFPPPPAKR